MPGILPAAAERSQGQKVEAPFHVSQRPIRGTDGRPGQRRETWKPVGRRRPHRASDGSPWEDRPRSRAQTWNPVGRAGTGTRRRDVEARGKAGGRPTRGATATAEKNAGDPSDLPSHPRHGGGPATTAGRVRGHPTGFHGWGGKPGTVPPASTFPRADPAPPRVPRASMFARPFPPASRSASHRLPQLGKPAVRGFPRASTPPDSPFPPASASRRGNPTVFHPPASTISVNQRIA